MHRAQVASLGLLAPGAEAMKCAPDSCGVGVHSPISQGGAHGAESIIKAMTKSINSK